MGNRQKMIDVCLSRVDSNWNVPCNAFNIRTEWCAMEICNNAKVSGNGDIFPWTPSCNEMIQWFIARGQWKGKTRDIRIGYIVFFDWNPNDPNDQVRPADHVGIVVEVYDWGFVTVEGNTGSNSGPSYTRVKKNEYSWSSQWGIIYGFASPAYDGGEITEKTEEIPAKTAGKSFECTIRTVRFGTEGRNVRAMQALLESYGCSVGSCGCDGEAGKDTVAAIKKFQKMKSIEADGICGPTTWGHLLS